MTDAPRDDTILIDRAQHGDKGALDELILRYQTRAYQYAFRLTHNSDEASDIVAEAFIRVYNALGHFKGQSSFSTWLYRIVTNCFLDLKKKEKSRPTVSLETPNQNGEGETTREVVDSADNPYEVSENASRSERIQVAIDRLPEYQRAMIVMYHVEMLAYEEISQALDLPIGTVKSRLNRARLALRELLQNDLELFGES
jgi:RNA polymerase sigma-70 factor (ECF subfamily)